MKSLNNNNGDNNQEMTAFANTEGFAITSVEQVQANQDLMNIVVNGWS